MSRGVATIAIRFAAFIPFVYTQGISPGVGANLGVTDGDVPGTASRGLNLVH